MTSRSPPVWGFGSRLAVWWVAWRSKLWLVITHMQHFHATSATTTITFTKIGCFANWKNGCFICSKLICFGCSLFSAKKLFDSSDDESEDEGLHWKSSKRLPALNKIYRARLPTALRDVLDNHATQIGEKPGFYKFVHLVTKRFRTAMNRYCVVWIVFYELSIYSPVACREHKRDPMVLKRELYIKESFDEEIKCVPDAVVASWEFDNAGEITDMLLSIMSQVFELPGEGAQEGSQEWIDSVLRTDSYSFENLIKHKKLMSKHLRKFKKSLPSDGSLPLDSNEVVPDRDYRRSRKYDYLKSGGCVHDGWFTRHNFVFYMIA